MFINDQFHSYLWERCGTEQAFILPLSSRLHKLHLHTKNLKIPAVAEATKLLSFYHKRL